MSKWSENNIGAMWKKKKNGKAYLVGHITINNERHKIVLFPNKYKTEEKHPEFILYRSFNDEQL
jgi:uncharacterized protein (DUF736 family)